MKYFIAENVAFKPYTRWNCIGDFETQEDFENSPFGKNPLVRPQSQITYQFGVCTTRIVGGILVDFTEAEMLEFQEQEEIIQALSSQADKIKAISKDSFAYDGKEFPMDLTSHLFYTSMEKIGGNQKIMTTANELYNLLDASIPAFMTAYYGKLLTISKHDI
jgi:hypothetical protein